MEDTDVFVVWMEMLERVRSLGLGVTDLYLDKNVVIISLLLQSSVESCN